MRFAGRPFVDHFEHAPPLRSVAPFPKHLVRRYDLEKLDLVDSLGSLLPDSSGESAATSNWPDTSGRKRTRKQKGSNNNDISIHIRSAGNEARTPHGGAAVSDSMVSKVVWPWCWMLSLISDFGSDPFSSQARRGRQFVHGEFVGNWRKWLSDCRYRCCAGVSARTRISSGVRSISAGASLAPPFGACASQMVACSVGGWQRQAESAYTVSHDCERTSRVEDLRIGC